MELGMANEIPFTTSQTSLTRLLKHIQDASIPPKVDRIYLKTVGFKASQDAYLVPILKRIGFISAKGVPEKSWGSYRDRQQSGKVLAEGVLKAYPKLFAIYSDAYRKDEEAIRNWVRSATKFDATKVSHAVATFKTLCSLSDFTGASSATDVPSDTTEAILPIASIPKMDHSGTAPGSPSININIELHLPPSADGVSYDKFFESMKRHLFPDVSTGK